MVFNKRKIIVIEGIDHSGKTTLIDIIAKYLKSKNIDFEKIKYPRKETEIGKIILDIINDNSSYDPLTLPFFFAIDRISDRRRLNKNKVILIDRFVYSNFAYQSIKLSEILKMDWKEIFEWLKSIEPPFLYPKIDFVFYSYVDIETVKERMKNKKDLTSYDIDLKFLEKVKEVYDYMFDLWKDKDPYGAKWIKIDNRKKIEEVERDVYKILEKIL